VTLRRVAAFIALLCAGIAGHLWLHLPLEILVVAVCGALVVELVGQLWLSEKAYRRTNRERAAHFLDERQSTNLQLRQRGD
jgi:hypothetical protein